MIVPSLGGTDFGAFEKFISDKSYVQDGCKPTEEDFKALAQLNGRIPDMLKFPCTYRWATHIAEKQRQFPRQFLSAAAPVVAGGNKGGANHKAAAGNKGKDEANIEGKLPNAVMGKVCTRFPPEPSGYMHIGHAKAALLNNAYARMYEGKLIVRFDDTNPSKEKQEFEDTILEDSKTLGIVPDTVTHTSDYFEELQKICATLIKKGDCYVDDTPMEKMREERDKGIESVHRNNKPEKNLELWEEMLKGSEIGVTCCVRAKMKMTDPVKCLRDPVMYRCKVDVPHHRHGTKYKAYPTYDFACPIVDAIEGVTHSLRTIEYKDRDKSYQWVQEKAGKGKSILYEFSKTQFTHTVLSKRKLTWFVDNNVVDGWNDPRFPTVKGVLRRGMTVPALQEFMKTQGASKRDVLMEWDKIWVLNRQIIDPQASRLAAVFEEDAVELHIKGVDGQYTSKCNLHPKFPENGTKALWHSNVVYLQQADALEIGDTEEITLIHWGNVKVTKIHATDKKGERVVTKIEAQLHLQGNVKDTKKKLHWVAKLPNKSMNTKVILREFDHLISKAKLDQDDKFEDYINPETVFDTPAIAEPQLKNVNQGDIIQLERIGFFICDRAHYPESRATPMILIKIPEGKANAMSKNIKGKVDPTKLQGGKKDDAAAAPAAGAASGANEQKGTPADHAALAAIKEKIAKMKAEGKDVANEITEMKRLKEVCGEVELSKAERKKLDKAKKDAEKAQGAPTAGGNAAASPTFAEQKGTPADHAALAAIKEKIAKMKAEGKDVANEVAEMKRLKEVCGEVELSKAERKKLDKAKKDAEKAGKK